MDPCYTVRYYEWLSEHAMRAKFVHYQEVQRTAISSRLRYEAISSGFEVARIQYCVLVHTRVVMDLTCDSESD